MENKRKISSLLLPLLFCVGAALGVWLGSWIFRPRISPAQQKLSEILSMIENEYVDDVDVDSLMEQMYPELLAMLDPHSAYIPASELTAVNEDLEGSFSGVGVSFQIINDTVSIIEVVAGGPSEKVGLRAGDKIRVPTPSL